MNGGGEEEQGGLKKRPSPGQQTLIQQPRSGASPTAEPGKSTLVPPTAPTGAPAVHAASSGGDASGADKNSAATGAKTAAGGASAADKPPAATAAEDGAGEAPAADKAPAATRGEDAVGAAPASTAAKDAVDGTPAADKAPASSGASAADESPAAAGSAKDAAAGEANKDAVAATAPKDGVAGAATTGTKAEQGPEAAGAAKNAGAPAGDVVPAAEAAATADKPPSGPPPAAHAAKGGGGHLAVARGGKGGASDTPTGSPAAGPDAGVLQKKAAGAEKAAKAPPPTQAPPPLAKTTVAAGPSRGAQHAAEQIQAALAAEQQALSAAVGAKRTALQAAADAQAEQILSSSASQYSATITAIGDREQSAKNTFAQARSQIHVKRLAEIELARTDAKDAEKRMRDGGTSITTRLKEAAESEGNRMKAAAQSSLDRCQTSAMKVAGDITAATINPRSFMSELTAGELVAIDHAVDDAKSQSRGELVFSRIKMQGELGGTALDNANAFREDADTIAGKVNEQLPQSFDAIHQTADATVTLINFMALGQLSAIDKAENATMSELEHAKTEARSVHDVGQITAADLRSKVVSQINVLNAHEATGSKGLAALTDEALSAINKKGQISHLEASHAVEATKKALKTGGHKLLAAVDETGTKALGHVNGSTAAYNAGVAGQREKLLKNVDGALAQVAGVLSQANAELEANCKLYRATAVSAYAAAETQVYAGTSTEIAKATSDWKQKASEFIASCEAYETETLNKHAIVRGAIQPQLENVARKTVSSMRRSRAEKILDGVKEGFSRFGTGMKVFIGLVIIVAAVLVVFAGMALGAALALAAAIVGIVLLGIGLIRSVITRLQQLWNNDWPWYAKIIGIPVALAVAVGDVFGLSQMAEGIRGRELISEKELTTEEAAARFTEGFLQLVTLGMMKEISEWGGAPKEVPPGRRGQGQLPPGDTAPPPETTTAPGETPTTTAPGETTTTTAKPGETTTRPAETAAPDKPADTTTDKPAESKPAETKPADIKADDRPASDKPVETKPAETTHHEPADTNTRSPETTNKPEQTTTEPSNAEPPSKPTVDKPGPKNSDPNTPEPSRNTNSPTKPAENKPAENKPAENKPAENKPVENKPAENKPAENPAPKAVKNTQPADVDAAVARIKSSGRLKGDSSRLDAVAEKAKAGDEGALGEIEALDRSVAAGEDVEVLPEKQNSGVRNPDHKVDGKPREVKTGSETDSDRTVSRKIDDANNQIKKSGLTDADGKPATGDADIQLRGDSAKIPLEEVDRQVRRQFNTNRSRSLDRVRVYQDGELVGEWTRQPDGTVKRTFFAGEKPSAPKPPGDGPDGKTPPNDGAPPKGDDEP